MERAVRVVDQLLGWPIANDAPGVECPGVGGCRGIAVRSPPPRAQCRESSPPSRRCRLPGAFHSNPIFGSQTSTLMSESVVGFSVAVTRQNAGVARVGARRRGKTVPGAGGLNAPCGDFGRGSDLAVTNLKRGQAFARGGRRAPPASAGARAASIASRTATENAKGRRWLVVIAALLITVRLKPDTTF